MDNHYKCDGTDCTIETEGGGGTKIYRGGRNMHSGGHFFLFICGEYEDGIMQATGGNLESITQGGMYLLCWDARTSPGFQASGFWRP